MGLLRAKEFSAVGGHSGSVVLVDWCDFKDITVRNARFNVGKGDFVIYRVVHNIGAPEKRGHQEWDLHMYRELSPALPQVD